MKIAKFVTEVKIIDPETGGVVEVSIYKHPCGGVFGVDSSYLEQVFEDDEDISIPDIFRAGSKINLEEYVG